MLSVSKTVFCISDLKFINLYLYINIDISKLDSVKTENHFSHNYPITRKLLLETLSFHSVGQDAPGLADTAVVLSLSERSDSD